jgi:hypothetical protein
MKRVRVPVLIEYQKVPRRYRGLLQRLQRGIWTRQELRWVLAHHRDLTPIVAAVVRERLSRGLGSKLLRTSRFCPHAYRAAGMVLSSQ